MCGICGAVMAGGRPVSARLIEAMNRQQRARGPDGEGVHVDGSVGLGHTRLSIIDVAAGAQPMVGDGVVVSFNGEIFNYLELRDELGAETFLTGSDTEVILRAYQRWGIRCIDRFRGMFAIAIHDRRAGKLYLVRDRVGIKPLYYAQRPDRLLFASDIRAIMVDPQVPDAIDQDGLAGYLHLQYVPTPRTIYSAVAKLEPGHVIEFDISTGRLDKRRYWEISPQTQSWTEAGALERLAELMDEVIRLHVRSDVPFGSFLSGGVDSSVVTAYMAQCLDTPVQTFTIGFNDPAFSELPWARQASEIIGTNHHFEIIDVEGASEILPTVVAGFGEPFADSSAIPTYFVSRNAAASVKMVLSGDGGDEIFGGYKVYQLMYRQHSVPGGGLTRRALGVASGLVPWPLRGTLRALSRTPAMVFTDCREILPTQRVGRMMADRRTPPPIALGGDVDWLLQAQLHDVGAYMLDDILTKTDRMSMASGLEVRVPLLDHHLIEFALSLPVSLRMGGTPAAATPKMLLKRLGERFFSRPFLDRPKMGFGIPTEHWLLGALRPQLEEMCSNWSCGLWEHVRHDRVCTAVRGFLAAPSGDYSAAHIWSLLVLYLWFRNVHQVLPRLADAEVAR
ncbi:MAG: asparagine synthase (glutamine-hydrolyzing) [Alphaproteobacteria bacterium]|nr:asparagine synthase (glutamine-hydrolyzing) [Alphaproteobacteria bacterium]